MLGGNALNAAGVGELVTEGMERAAARFAELGAISMAVPVGVSVWCTRP